MTMASKSCLLSLLGARLLFLNPLICTFRKGFPPITWRRPSSCSSTPGTPAPTCSRCSSQTLRWVHCRQPWPLTFELLHLAKIWGRGVTWCWLTSLVQVSSLTNVGQPTGGVREMLNATAVAIGQGQRRLNLRGQKAYRHELGQLQGR